jgi:outer membrane receptor protein involved in Fe transport
MVFNSSAKSFAVLFALVSLLFSSAVYAQDSQKPQTGKLSGRIVDAGSKPVPYATITLLKTDSTVVNGDLTKEDGSFSIAPTGIGTFLLRINILGFKQRFIKDLKITAESPEKKLGNIKISAEEHTLNEVQVTAEKSLMEMHVDKKVFNVEKNITTTGGSAADVLQNVPSLTVDPDGNVSLRGKDNVTILIDGKPATLLGGDNASALQSLPASSISNVEVITNPSSKYDAQGMTGIVNIITKKDRKTGLNGSVSLGAGTNDKYNGSLNLNLKNDKWNVFLNSSFRQNRSYRRETNDGIFYNGTPSYESYEDNLRQFGGWFNTIGAEYTFDQKNTLMLTQNINKMQWGGKGTSVLNTFDSGHVEQAQRRSFDQMGSPLSSSTALNYKHKFSKPKQELTVDATFAKTWVDRTQNFTTNYYDGSETLTEGPILQTAPGEGSNTSWNLQADFTTPLFTKTDRFDAGWKSQLYSFESHNNPLRSESGSPAVVDAALLNSYDYSQSIHAAYLNYNDQRGKWSYQAGLRMEYAGYEGTTMAVNGKEYTNEFLNLFPSAYLSYQLPAKQTMYLSYTRRTDRPHFHQMMPYIDISNLQDTSAGNPNLIPEFIHNIEFNYAKQFEQGHSFIASAYYQYTQNLITHYKRFSNGGSYTQPQNLAAGITYGLELIGKAQILPIWDATLNFNFFQTEIQGANVDPSLQNSGFSWFGKINTNLRLPQGFSLQLNGNYEAPEIEAQGTEKAVYFVDAALKKSFLKNKASIVLNVSDIFNTRKYSRRYDLDNYYQLTYNDRETRIANITFSYRFGKSDVGKRRAQSRTENGVKDRSSSGDDDGDQGGF